MIDDATMMAATAEVDTGPALLPDDGPRFVASRPRRDGERDHLDALDRRLDRPVAVTRSARPLSPDGVARFLRGARIAGRLEHPGVPCILALGVDDDGHGFFVEPRRRTVPLAAWCRGAGPDGPPTLGRRLSAFVDVCRAIAHAHRLGVVHGTLTAEVVDLGEGGEPRVGGWDHATVEPDGPIAQADLGAAVAARQPTIDDDRAALVELLELVLGDDRDAAPELAALLDAAHDAPAVAVMIARVNDYLDGERDLALRAVMAAQLTTTAKAAVALGGANQEQALRLARRALALDPRSDDAAAIVARLLVELPDPLPPAAAAAVARSDERVIQRIGVGMIAAFGAFFLYAPLMLIQGVRSPVTAALITVMTGVMLVWAIRWQRRGPHVFTWPPMLGAAAILTLYAQTYGPFVNAPAQAALATMAVMFFPRHPRSALVVGTFAIPVVGTFALEQLGWLHQTTRVVAGRVAIDSHVVATEPVATYAGLVFVAVVLVIVAGAMAGFLTASQRRHTRALLALSWKIRALTAPLSRPPTDRETSPPPT
ncbi:MAG: hypothetical protein R3B06_22300 [Kofleriaceae bacterium]